MLLNEMQRERQKITIQATEIRELEQQQLRTQQEVAELRDLNESTQVALRKLQSQAAFVAQR
jgi:hypothetical protein